MIRRIWRRIFSKKSKLNWQQRRAKMKRIRRQVGRLKAR